MAARLRTHLAPTLLLALFLVGCTSADAPDQAERPSADASTPSPSAPPDPTQDKDDAGPRPASANPEVRWVPPGQWRRMKAAGMVRPECPVQRRAQLRRLDVNHYDFRGRVRRGHLVVNADVAASAARIFARLFDAKFPIRRMQSVEAYGGDNTASLQADNTASFNCRQPDQINAPFGESPHANGRAIDVNPRENPWMDLRCDCWSPGARFAERSPGPGKVLRGGVVWRAFRDEGWIWQNIDVADYMHFDTGYPSRPYEGPGES